MEVNKENINTFYNTEIDAEFIECKELEFQKGVLVIQPVRIPNIIKKGKNESHYFDLSLFDLIENVRLYNALVLLINSKTKSPLSVREDDKTYLHLLTYYMLNADGFWRAYFQKELMNKSRQNTDENKSKDKSQEFQELLKKHDSTSQFK